MRVHFIAIGGAVMHNLAIALHRKGYQVTGSDDEIFEPSRSRLASHGLLPQQAGWFPEKLDADTGTVILGMHAKEGNPELEKARELGLKIYSFPEYLYEQTKDKKRIVVAGSHGKTTTTAIIMHVFRKLGLEFDYMVGSQIDGFDTMVGLSSGSKLAVFEGDEYLTSALDRRPKFHLYMPDIAIINGIAWDHMNVFPTYENYVEQFRIFTAKITPGGTLIYYADDEEVKKVALTAPEGINRVPYRTHGYFQNKEGFFAATHNRVVPVRIFGEHNMQNLSAAKAACLAAGVPEDDFYEAVKSFDGTSKRLQKILENDKGVVYLDFAHSPSKVKATTEAVAERYRGRKIIACLELHTFSSLSRDFLPGYRGTLDSATEAFVYFNPHAVELKKLAPVSKEEIAAAFGKTSVRVFDNSDAMFSEIRNLGYDSHVYLFMSSGDFNGYDIASLLS
ncbi:MAG: Mur ligase family protein [Bacteroidales bacterium]|jgi:UDP-N-acetylmuramate: L-alanyl-gamma-D-glutamyl-meso-diaminopimelate ligase|nr:Mur ligase family protein [Bacteroidales bacterium]